MSDEGLLWLFQGSDRSWTRRPWWSSKGGPGGGGWEVPDRSGPVTHRELGSSHYSLHAGLPTQFCSAGVFTGAFGITVFASFITGDNYQTNYLVTQGTKLIGWSKKKNVENHNVRLKIRHTR